MLIIGLFVLLGLVPAYYGFKFVWRDFSYDKIFVGAVGCFFSLIVIAAAGGMGLGVAAIVGHETINPPSYYLVRQTELLALNDVNGLHGRFFLGSGFIDSRFKYVYYYRAEDGSIQLGARYPYEVKLYEELREDAVMLNYAQDGVLSSFGIRFGGQNRIEIRVPQGTILRSVNLDLR